MSRRMVGRPSLGLMAALALVGELAAAQGVPDTIPGGTVLVGRLSFDAKATMGPFIGATSDVSGAFVGGPLRAVNGAVEASARSLATGNAKRDRDMYKSLEVEEHPTIKYSLDSLSVSARRGDTAETTFHGSFTIHGVTRPAPLPATLVFEDSLVRVRGATPLNLKDYEIGGLSKFLGVLKMDEEIVVHVEVVFLLARDPDPPPPGQ